MGANAANAGFTPGSGFDAQAAARAGTGGGLTLFNPVHESGPVTPMEGRSFAELKSGFADQRAELAQQRAMAQQLRKEKAAEEITNKKYEAMEASPAEFQYYGDSMFGMLPKDYDPQRSGAKAWEGGDWDFSGVDKGWEQYEADYQKSIDPKSLTPGTWEYIQRMNMQALQGSTGLDPLHAISWTDENNMWRGDPRDPYGYGSDYSRYYDLAHGEGALKRQAQLFAKGYAENDPAYAGYRQGYGDIDWNDANQVEDLFRRMNTGGTKTAQMQDMIAQNKRTEMTEAGIMMALAAGMGALAAPAAGSIGYGGTYGASTAAEQMMYSTLANQMTADALARTAIQGAYQVG